MEKLERNLFLRGYVDENNTGEIIEKIVAINKEDCECNLFREKRKPINLHIQSQGGNVMDAFALVDIITNSSTPVHTFCEGYAESSALDIYLAGEERYVFKHSRFLIHGTTSTAEDMTLPNIEARIAMVKDLERFGKNLLMERTRLTNEQVEKLYTSNVDTFLGAKEALEYGIATGTIGEV